MSDEMPSWRSLASAASRSIKSYVSQRDLKRSFPASRDIDAEGVGQRQTWGQWAGKKLRQVQGEVAGTEQMLLFPGWATRRFHEPPSNDNVTGESLLASMTVYVLCLGWSERNIV